MAKAPAQTPKDTEPQPAPEAFDEAALAPSRPGPDEPPSVTPERGATPDPAVFAMPQPKPLSKGQVTGLCAEALEAYMFGQRTRHDANGRLWNMRREAENDVWQLGVTVSLGPLWLADGAIPLDRLPSADGEHQLIALIESLAAQVDQLHADLWAAQQKAAKGRE